MNNREDVYKILGASNHSKTEREEVDFYSTDPDCVKDLLEREKFSETILEPCCGNGNIAKVLEEAGYKVVATDLYDHGYGKSGIDLFSYKDISNAVITNPPYGMVDKSIIHLLNELKPGTKMALFLKLQFLEGKTRYNEIFSKGGLKAVYIYVNRVCCYKNDERYQKDENGNYILDKNGNKKKNQSAVAYARYIFEKGYTGDPIIKWIND